MKSLHKRLDEQKEAVLSMTKRFGRFKAMREFGVSDYSCFTQWLKEATGDENFGLNPQISLDGHQSLGDQLVSAFLCKVANLQTENQKLREQIKNLNWQLQASSEKEGTQALAVLEVCQA